MIVSRNGSSWEQSANRTRTGVPSNGMFTAPVRDRLDSEKTPTVTSGSARV